MPYLISMYLLYLVVVLTALQVCVCVCVCVFLMIYIFCTGAKGPLVNGDLRLNTDGSSRTFSGLLEIYYNGQWGTVCDDGFSQPEADVACRQLGFVEALFYGNNIG